VRGVEYALAAWQTRPPDSRPLILIDFDGALAEFEADPAAVKLPESRRALLQSLAARADLSGGIVSGRRIADLRERVAAGASMFYAGLHGMEIEGPGLRFMHAAAALAAPVVGILARELRRATSSLAGVIIEDRALSVVMHLRGASKADRLHAATRFRALSEPHLNDGLLRLQPGSELLELLPNVDWTKGDAVKCMVRQVEAQHGQTAWPVYIGDDLMDEDAFEEIGVAGLTIAVASIAAHAAISVPDSAAVETFLRAILATE
jgi:trehalose-phosphatase